MYDYSMLLGRMREKGTTQEELAKQINRNPATLTQKLKGRTYFTQREMAAICQTLDIRMEEMPNYFFTHKLRK